MSRNANVRFASNPTNVDIQRSKFNRPSEYKTSFNVGDLIPFYVDEVLPGDTHQIRTNKVVRMQPLVSAPMDNLYLDTYYFFVPNRLVWEHWKEFMGENTQSAWIPSTTYQVPQIIAPSGGWTKGTIADYMGVPTLEDNFSISALQFRAYALIVNEFFRDENLCQPLNIPVDETTITGVNSGNQVTDIVKGGLPFVCAKFHDYFTSCLPSPQKGPDVTLTLAGLPNTVAVVPQTLDNATSLFSEPLHFCSPNSSGTWDGPGSTRTLSAAANSGDVGIGGIDSIISNLFYPSNLAADFSSIGTVNIATINQLRTAFAIQKLYERDARGGTRYIELLKSHFGVTSPDARLQRPEYLGGNRVPININQVVQTSNSNTGITPQGNVAGYSLTSDTHGEFIKSFTEHGFIIGVMVARYDHTYQQGLNRMWSRKDRFDYYFPVFANIGEQAVKNKEIYLQGSSAVNPSTGKAYDDEVFGYQEAWAEYRYKPSIVTGEMRSNISTSLDSWHFADDYTSLPALGSSWISEDKSNVDRTLAVSSSVSNQLFADLYIENETTRPMPMYSIPGLLDHN